jgi:Fe2+ or Zn2+ uptake regulation protein
MDTTDHRDIADLKGVLRAHGLRATVPRVAVLQALDAVPSHLSAEEIARAVEERYPAFDRVSLYRTVEAFETHGLAVRVAFGDRVLRWERDRHAHHHIECRHCGAIIELDTVLFERLAADLAAAYGVRVDLRHLALPGICTRCVSSMV